MWGSEEKWTERREDNSHHILRDGKYLHSLITLSSTIEYRYSLESHGLITVQRFITD